ncbi:MAG: helix-turn-helix transcriptional regulator, partial [Pyrinomonadaceae bacterium]
EHTLAALGSVPTSRLTAVASRDKARIAEHHEVDLLVIGIARYPVRRLFISQLRRIYPQVPVLILRREDICPGEMEECVRGEFILSDQREKDDYEIVRSLRWILPLSPCQHTHKGYNYDTVREVIRVIAEKYSDPDLDLDRVAKELPMSPKRLSRILNQQVGVSFRQLLRDMRIEEAKRMLASRRFSVKEVAVRVGFSDSHYFSRSFKELTGLSASEYRSHTAIFS